jgi:hypothetical protein
MSGWTISLPAALLLPAWKWLQGRLMPRPEFMRALRKAEWGANPQSVQWTESIRLKRGWLEWERHIEDCRLYFMRKDFGPDRDPEGIWLKWIEGGRPIDSLKITMEVGKTYESILVVRNEQEGTAYIANETFLQSRGNAKKFPLDPIRPAGINDIGGYYTFYLEIRSGKRRWRGDHYYAAFIPPAGVSNEQFKVETRDNLGPLS